MSWITKLFCKHNDKVIAEKEEQYTVHVKETLGTTSMGAKTFGGGSQFLQPGKRKHYYFSVSAAEEYVRKRYEY